MAASSAEGRRRGPPGGKLPFKSKQARGGGGGSSQTAQRNAVTGNPSVHGRSGPWKQRPGPGNTLKKRWKSSQQVVAGSVKEGKGFTLWKKQKVQLEYKKLQRKQKKTATAKDLYADSYPEHLKHLYLAEEERLNSLERKRKPEAEDVSQTAVEQEEVVPKKKFKKKTANQKAKELYEQVQRDRAKKRKEAEENRRKREEAKELYQKKKMEAYKVLSSKTKKGQPNFNVQMEYLLKKIQSKT